MSDLRYTLLCDGSSDRALMPILTWVLRESGIKVAIQPSWADLHHLPRTRQPRGLSERIAKAVAFYPCDLLFVHRDAEGLLYDERREEIMNAISEASAQGVSIPIVCVVPVRMTEAWLLSNEASIRSASGNPNGKVRLAMPDSRTLERIPDPKNTLHTLLRDASELKGRRLSHMNVHRTIYRVAELTDDFSALRKLPAFAALFSEVENAVRALSRIV